MAHALDLVGERWALLVVRELMLGPKRFTDLRSSLPGISPNILAQRLRELGTAGVLAHSRLPPPASHQIYELTAHGHELETVVDALGRWALRSPSLTMAAPRSKDSHVLFLRMLFDPRAARGFTAEFALWLGEEHFRVRIADQRISLTRGRPDNPDATIDTTIPALHAMLRRTCPLDELISSGDLRVYGDREMVTRLPGLFSYPPGRAALLV
jgi:DNA-binding HxlR family transcriptional regulator